MSVCADVYGGGGGGQIKCGDGVNLGGGRGKPRENKAPGLKESQK
jgi:hypothetical protein